MMEASICSSICSQEENVNLYFVELVEDSPSNILLCAHQACEKFSRRWLSVEDCKQVTPTKEDIFICDPFEGEAFEYLVSCPNSIVVGPRCILSCLHRMEPIPVLPSPLHNTAMSGVVITTTGFPKAQKEELQQLVQRMSGIYSNNYHQDVTHLVVKMVGSKKYKVAVEQGVPTMTEEWVRAVWKAVVTGDVSDHVSATDNRFLVPYLCQPLHGLVLCVSQTEPSIKMTLKKLIEENGGTYTTNLTREETSVLIVSSPVGKKYRYATKWGVPCVFPDWLHNSVQQGHALDKEEYEVLPRKSSTLNSIHSNDMPPDLSMCSTILNDTEAHRTITSVDETVGLEESVVKERASVEENIEDVEALENLDLQEAMKAGSFLKGYRVFLAGFNPIHMEKLRRVLGAVGASRLSQLTESATHVVLAVPSEEHLRIMRGWNIKPHVVSVRWITESVHLKHPAEESHFTFPVQANREVQLSQTSTQRSFISNTALDNDETYVDEKLLEEHFLQPKRRKSSGRESDQDLSMLPESQVSELPGIFNGKTFTVFGHCQETIEELEEMIELHGGHVVQMESSEVIHYSVVTTRALRHQNKGQLISRAFLEDCIETKRLLAVEYYHLPLLLPSNSFPLDDCCITISTYANKERLFLEHMAILLGAQHQEKFSKMSKPGMNILANTHLLCPTPIGAKYNAARKWAIPAVTCDWLIECARSGQKVSEKTFLVDCSNNNTVQLPRKAIIMELWDSALREGEKMQEMGEEQEDVVPPTPTVAKIKSVRSTEIKSAEVLASSPDRPFDWEAISRMYPTPGTTRFYQAKLDAELDAMPIPNTPYGLTWYSDPPPKIKKCIKKLIDSLPDPSLELANSPTKSPTEELFCEFFVNVSEELLVLTKKIKEKEEKGDHSEEERDSHLSISQDTDLEVKCPTKDLSMHDEFNEKEQENVVKVRADERLSHQLEENAHTTLVERSGGITGRSKVPLAELQRPTTSSKMHHIDVKSQPNEEVENLAIETAWNDPEEHKFRLRLQDHMQDTQDFSAPINKEDEAKPTIDDSNKENISSAPQQGKLPPPPYKEKNKARSNIITSTEIPNQRVFVLVGMSTEEVEDYEEMVVHLGGTVSPSQTVEACVTHVIAKVLSRSERTLMSIVSGMWLLMTSYLDHSLKAGHFLKEEPFAWGNQSSNHHPMLEPESIQDKLAKAAWRWKCAICRVDDGQDKQHWQKQQPFQNMTALIHSQKAKSLSRIIEAGGGQVVSARPPYSEVEGVTHFFVEMEKPHEKIDLASFASRDIPCLEPLFIKSVIMEDTTEISDFYIPAYKEILINMSSCIPSPLKRALRN